ncbi:MAG: ribosomal L7Ae/L30e/S12e/Gadd45 family protein [Ruminococcus sp.]|nr:ribosomal L7Ae/L30e/S12e/Gadd45 family protein [Candidatus Copronaster equi]
MNDLFLNLLGLCRKAGKLSLGHDACKLSINSGKASVVFITSDASERLIDEIEGLAQNKEIRIFYIKQTMLDIRSAVGFKAAVFSVDDDGFAKSLINKLNENKNGEERSL